jgi:hypothetical protein
LTALQTNMQKATSEFTTVQKQNTDTAAAVKHWQDMVNQAATDPTLAAAKAAEAAVPAKEQAAVKLAEAAVRAKEAADRLGNNAELTTFALQSQALASKHTAELAAAKQYAVQMVAAAKPAQDRLAAAHAELGKAQVANNAVAQQLPAKQAALKSATDQMTPAQAAVQAATAELQLLQAQVARMQKASDAQKAAGAKTTANK